MPLDAYYITNETSEDRLDCANTLPDALRIARSLALEGRSGELVYIEHQGKNIRQLIRTPEGFVREETLA